MISGVAGKAMKPLASGTGNASGVTRQFLSGTRSVVSQTSVATFLGRLELYAPQFASSSPKSRINASFVSGSLLRTLPGRLLCARDVEEQLLRACVARQFTTTFGHAKRRHPSERPIMWSVAIDRLCGKLLGLRILDSCSILGPTGVAARGQAADVLLKRMIMSRSQGYMQYAVTRRRWSKMASPMATTADGVVAWAWYLVAMLLGWGLLRSSRAWRRVAGCSLAASVCFFW